MAISSPRFFPVGNLSRVSEALGGVPGTAVTSRAFAPVRALRGGVRKPAAEHGRKAAAPASAILCEGRKGKLTPGYLEMLRKTALR